MPTLTAPELTVTLEQLQQQMAEIARQIAALKEQAAATITEGELIAISAAIGAYLGVRPHIRQIRLVSTNAWAQQGRVSIQASHMLQS